MKFSDKQIAALKPRPARYEILEGDGLTIRVSPGGAKTWQHVWKKDGKTHRRALGRYPDMSLADAREANRQCLSDRHKGIDPRGEKVAAAKVVTVADIVDDFILRYLPTLRRGHEVERYLRKECAPLLGIEAEKLHRREVVMVVNGMIDRGSPVSAYNWLKGFKRCWSWAIAQGLTDNYAATAGVTTNLPAKKERALSEEEIKIFWRVISTAGRVSPDVRNVLKLILVTAQRPSECLGIHAGEISGEWWTIPAERHKQHKAHSVYLSPLAVSLIAPYSVQIRSMSHCLKRLIQSGTLPLTPFTPHDLRRTAATGMARIGIPHETIERVLGHSIAGVGAIYNRHDYREEIRAALATWGEYVQGITATASTRR